VENHTALDEAMEVGVSTFFFSIKMPEKGLALNYSHEYQIVFIEPSDGTHVFGVQLGKHSLHASLAAFCSKPLTPN
jgi:hypothetical protein